MKTINLTQGYIAMVDDADYEELSKFKWTAIVKSGGRVYAYRMSKKLDGWQKRGMIFMHRVITDCPEDLVVDHKNHNTLDNRQSNLRVCSHTENMRNRSTQSNNKFGTPGVTLVSRNANKPYRVTIRVGEKWPKYVGSFPTLEEAAQAYKQAAQKWHKDFAYNG